MNPSSSARPVGPDVAEYRACQIMNQPVQTGEAIALAGLFLLVFLSGCLVLNLWLTSKWWRPDLGMIDVKLNAIAQVDQPIDVVALGPSHMDFGFNPEVFDAQMAQLGHKTSTFNLSVEALKISEREFMLREVFRQIPGRLRIVLLECELRAAPEWENMLHGRTRFFSAYPWVRKQLGTKLFSGRNLASRLGSGGKIVCGFLLYNLNPGVASDLLFPPVNEGGDSSPDRCHTESGWQYSEIRSRSKNPQLIRKLLDRATATPRGRRQLTDDEFGPIQQDLDFVIRQGALPVVVFPPVTAGLEEDFAIVDHFRAARPDVLVLDFTARSEDWQRFQDPELWLDGNHLDAAGAAELSRRIAIRLDRILPAGIFSPVEN
jgi:hypothetical protein